MSVGSTWYKFDFHNHTPASDDYLRQGTTDRDWLLAYMQEHVDGVIISDHNSGARIDTLKRELQLMQVEYQDGRLPTFRELSLFPGVELTATGNVHILAIFHEDSSGGDVERLIGQCNHNRGVPRGEPNHELVLGLGPAAIIHTIQQQQDALCILAHIDAPKGALTSLTNEAELRDAFGAGPNAVELRGHPSAITNGLHRQLIENLPHVRGSDAHDPAHAGSRTCWLKMSELNFDGLRNALLDHSNCVLFDTLPPSEPALHLRSLRLRTRLCSDGNQGPAHINFSPFYNAVIGSRGSGKSTLIESIRLAMRREGGLTSKLSERLHRFKSIGHGMDVNSEIECVYRKNGADFRLSWRPDASPVLHAWQGEEWVEDLHWSSDRFSLSLYSQKMLYELASDNDAFLRVCDESPIVNRRRWDEVWDQLVRDYKTERQRFRGIVAQSATASAQNGELEDTERAIAQLSASEYFPFRNQLTESDAEVAVANRVLTEFSDRLENLRALPQTIKDTLHPQECSVMLSSMLDALKITSNGFEVELSALLDSHEAALREFRNSAEYSTLLATANGHRTSAMQEAEKLRTQGLNPDTLDGLMSQRDAIKLALQEHAGLEQTLQESSQRLEALLVSLKEHRMALTQLRRDFLQTLSLDGLDIKVLPLSAAPDSIVASYQKITGITTFADRIYDNEDGSGLLSELIACIPYNPSPAAADPKYRLLDSLKTLHVSLREDNSGITGQNLHGAFRNRLKLLNDDVLDELTCWYPEDGIDIRYRAHNGRMENIESASPGQKGASMLQFLLSYGTDPLILDQPEDDLDCMMLSESVIPAIAANKQRRQLIIVSHSAPIVVNGDAEYVISMIHDRYGLRPALCGTLQEKPLRELICRQMEGGERAFRARYRRILS